MSENSCRLVFNTVIDPACGWLTKSFPLLLAGYKQPNQRPPGLRRGFLARAPQKPALGSMGPTSSSKLSSPSAVAGSSSEKHPEPDHTGAADPSSHRASLRPSSSSAAVTGASDESIPAVQRPRLRHGDMPAGQRARIHYRVRSCGNSSGMA